MDAKGVARLYPSRARVWDVVILVGAVLITFGLMLVASRGLRLYVDQTLDDFVDLLQAIL